MPTHYFRARVDQFVAGMDDTAVVAVTAPSKAEAVAAVCEPHLGNDDYFKFTHGTWADAGRTMGDDDRPPSTGPVHYLGTNDDLLGEVEGDAVMLSAVEGERVTADDLPERFHD